MVDDVLMFCCCCVNVVVVWVRERRLIGVTFSDRTRRRVFIDLVFCEILFVVLCEGICGYLCLVWLVWLWCWIFLICLCVDCLIRRRRYWNLNRRRSIVFGIGDYGDCIECFGIIMWEIIWWWEIFIKLVKCMVGVCVCLVWVWWRWSSRRCYR